MTLHGNKRQAFTMVELLIIISILSMIMSVVLPYLNRGFNKLKLHSAASSIRTFMYQNMHNAVVEGLMVNMTFDPANNSCYAKKADNKNDRNTRSMYFPAGVKLETDKNQINFYPDGRIDPVQIQLSVNENEKAVLNTKGSLSEVNLHFEH